MSEHVRTGERPVAAALAGAADTAGYAPSVHNTQPWRWVVHPTLLDLYADRDRQLVATDPDGRLLIMSCGAALHHARGALAAEGLQVETARTPDPADRDLLARLAVSGRVPVTPEAMRLVQAMRIRRTDRRPLSDQPLPPAAVDVIRRAVTNEDCNLHVLTGVQVAQLASVAQQARVAETADPQIRGELIYWTGRDRPAGTGMPAEVLPEQEPQTSVPGRDFGVPGALPMGPGHDRFAVFALLFGDEDEPGSWLRAGEALSAAWLAATELGVSLVPLSGAVEVPATRQTLRGMLGGLGQPYLVLRLGVADPYHAGPPHTPRLPAKQVVDTSEVHHAE